MQGISDITLEKNLMFGGLSLLALAGTFCAPGSALAAATEEQSKSSAIQSAEVVVDGSCVISPVNRRIMGQNILAYQEKHRKIYSMQGGGMWDSDNAAPIPEMISFLKEAGAKTLRWPGGCGSHTYNWKLTVGPLSERPTQAFGLPEFLRCCEAVGAAPIITLGDYWGGPDDFADLVEYLNSPVGKNPNGGTDWAAVRAKDGHPEPYNVVWFEYGNESSHGPHQKTRDVWFEYCSKSNQGPERKTRTRDIWYAYTVTQYAELYRKVQTAMKAVDPKIKLGAILDNEYQPRAWHDWTFDIVKLTGSYADFYINHMYVGAYDTKSRLPATELFRLGFSGARQTELVLQNLSRYIKNTTGRNIPLALTEFNCGIDQELPVPYRFSQGAAIMVAEIVLTIMSNPELNVDNAQYWQFCNEHWGMISHFSDLSLKNKRAQAIQRPPFLAYVLCNKYLGDSFVKKSVDCDSYETRGGFGMQPALGEPSPFRQPDKVNRKVKADWKITPDDKYVSKVEQDGSLSVKILDKPLEYCNAQLNIPVKPLVTYQISAEVKTDGNPNFAVAFEVGDGRAWNTYCRDRVAKGTKSTKWFKVSCLYESLRDTPHFAVRIKCMGKDVKEGLPFSFSVRNFTIKEVGIGQDLGRIPYIQAYASNDKDGGSKLILVNLNITSPVKIKVKGLKGKVTSAEVLSAPSVDSTNEKKQNCQIVPLKYSVMPDGALEMILPPYSLSGVATR